VGPRAVLDTVVKRKIPSPRRESNPRTPIVQSVAQRYTDRAITAPCKKSSNKIKVVFREIGIDGANWIRLAQDRVQWQDFVNTVMNLRVPYRKPGIF
jgi:hypothetical protein